MLVTVRVEEILRAAHDVVVVDWPSPDVPDTLARAGYAVHVHGGPAPDEYAVYALEGQDVVVSRTGRPPERADLVYSHRPLDELGGIVDLARRLGATAIWVQSGRTMEGRRDPKGCWLPEAESRRARAMVGAAGLAYVDDRYLPDEVRALGVDASGDHPVLRDRRARVEDVHELAAGMPHVTVETGPKGNAVYQVGGKSFVLFRNPRPDAVDPLTGDRYDDVIVIWVPSDADKEALVHDANSPFFTTPHFEGHPSVLVRASRIGDIGREELAEIIQDAWLAQASPRRGQAWLRSTSARAAPS